VSMGYPGTLVSRLLGKKPGLAGNGDMRKSTGAGPAIAAHSKDAKTTAPTGQNRSAAAKEK
ncbi:hypothetical protein EN925_36850, partial [Mesorhizobium sp. M7A.F.Ca.US.006.04.2.1]|uniref:hypothetical protein n=1 Tax=Mesorhizobium sp. M7A.F.Ca.US.006.04.2.1 TaxID=2496696 RepID=UPI000FD2652D